MEKGGEREEWTGTNTGWHQDQDKHSKMEQGLYYGKSHI